MKIARIEREKERETKESLAVTLIVLTCWIESIEGKRRSLSVVIRLITMSLFHEAQMGFFFLLLGIQHESFSDT